MRIDMKWYMPFYFWKLVFGSNLLNCSGSKTLKNDFSFFYQLFSFLFLRLENILSKTLKFAITHPQFEKQRMFFSI